MYIVKFATFALYFYHLVRSSNYRSRARSDQQKFGTPGWNPKRKNNEIIDWPSEQNNNNNNNNKKRNKRLGTGAE